VLDYKKILCAFEFDEISIAALLLAAKLCKESNATLYLAHIARVPNEDMDVPVPIAENPRWERKARAKLASIAKQNLTTDVKYRIEVRSGYPDVDIVSMAHELKVDLIVMATHGRSGFSHLLVGSVAEHVIREATCPVLIIRPARSKQH